MSLALRGVAPAVTSSSDGSFGEAVAAFAPFLFLLAVVVGVLALVLLSSRPLSLPSVHHYLGRRGSRAPLVLTGAREGWKVAHLVLRPGAADAAFSSVAHSSVVRADANASCLHGCKEPASVSCSCGFYSYSTEDLARSHDQGSPSAALLRVAVSGRFVEYSRGWRSSHQRTELVRVRTRCCSRGCGAPAQAFLLGRSSSDGWVHPSGVCAPCLARFRWEGQVVTFASVASLLSSHLRTPGAPAVEVVSDVGAVPLTLDEVRWHTASPLGRAALLSRRLLSRASS